ncbi:hypothetical protein MNBD_GAMMA08-1526, partial [hydrothermal vent metagenome]
HLKEIYFSDYQGIDIGRDAIVNYCINEKIEIVTEKYPSTLVSPGYREFMDDSENNGKTGEDYEEFHNNIFIYAFSRALVKLGYNTINVYYECFESELRARCYEIKIEKLADFLNKSVVPVYFIDDALFFSPGFKCGLCLFHHELLDFFSFGASSKDLYALTVAGICNECSL